MTAPAKNYHLAKLIERALRVEGGHLSIGRYRASLHYGDGCHMSGLEADVMKIRRIGSGPPVLDSRPGPYEGVWKRVATGPMIAVGH